MTKLATLIALSFLVFFKPVNASELKKSDIKFLKSKSDVKSFGCEEISGYLFKPINKKTEIGLMKNAFKKDKLYGNSNVSCFAMSDSVDNKVEIQKLETIDIDGAVVKIYHGRGSAEISPVKAKADSHSTWLTSCHQDEMTDSKLCSLGIKNLSIYKSGSANSLYIGLIQHFPNRTTMIRIDKNNPFSTIDNHGAMKGSDFNEIVNQIKNGKKIIIRYYEWPNDFPVDGEIDNTVFTQAMQVYQKVSESF